MSIENDYLIFGSNPHWASLANSKSMIFALRPRNKSFPMIRQRPKQMKTNYFFSYFLISVKKRRAYEFTIYFSSFGIRWRGSSILFQFIQISARLAIFTMRKYFKIFLKSMVFGKYATMDSTFCLLVFVLIKAVHFLVLVFVGEELIDSNF